MANEKNGTAWFVRLSRCEVLCGRFVRLFIEGLFIAPPNAQGHLRAFPKFESHTRHIKKHLTFKKQFTKTNFFLNLKIVLSVLPLCTIAIQLGHAGIVDLAV